MTGGDMEPPRRLWVDDLRDPPEDGNRWWVARSSAEALEALALMPLDWWDAVSLDHDLGGEDTTRPVLTHIIQEGYAVKRVLVHTQNPVGRVWLAGTIERYLA